MDSVAKSDVTARRIFLEQILQAGCYACRQALNLEKLYATLRTKRRCCWAVVLSAGRTSGFNAFREDFNWTN